MSTVCLSSLTSSCRLFSRLPPKSGATVVTDVVNSDVFRILGDEAVHGSLVVSWRVIVS